jgi:glycerol-3-phosphate O-acyltransferase/dihydroxyacetone phosphate acyltransferase
LIIWALLALPGTILNGPMFILASMLSRQKAKGMLIVIAISSLPSNPLGIISAALAASAVKVAGRDVLATWKILICLGVAPILYSFYAFTATMVAIKANAPLKWTIATPFIVLFSLPFMSYAALNFGEAGMDVLKRVLWSNHFLFHN